MLRYLSHNATDSWLIKNGQQPLTGFTWKGGSEPVTQGIWIWSEIFELKIQNNDVAVILVDTQGTFDPNR